MYVSVLNIGDAAFDIVLVALVISLIRMTVTFCGSWWEQRWPGGVGVGWG